ncbi:MAG: 30S ribosomal protein S13 [Hadesarchaea archaeon]|nr:MAG: 30S ribosomal protein S13 [Hadesarchaea archaeon]TDA34037.1 MAG: 30S ribosomal protein S13 [Hadesarchaea archaeon]
MAEFKHIVRMIYKDLPGEKSVQWALSELKGVGPAFARAAALAVGVNPSEKLGSLDEETLKKLEEVLRDPAKYGIPSWMLNRRKDYETGKDLHLIGPDLEMAIQGDIGLERKIRSRRGIRHELGLPVRGQRTRTTGRKGMTVGVKRKETRIKEEAAKAKEKKEKKKEEKKG